MQPNLASTAIAPVLTHAASAKLDESRLKETAHCAARDCAWSNRTRQIPSLARRSPAPPFANFRKRYARSDRLPWLLRGLSIRPSGVDLLIVRRRLDDEELTPLIRPAYCSALGPRVLRTETAAVGACRCLQALWVDFSDASRWPLETGYGQR